MDDLVSGQMYDAGFFTPNSGNFVCKVIKFSNAAKSILALANPPDVLPECLQSCLVGGPSQPPNDENSQIFIDARKFQDERGPVRGVLTFTTCSESQLVFKPKMQAGKVILYYRPTHTRLGTKDDDYVEEAKATIETKLKKNSFKEKFTFRVLSEM